MQKKRLLFELYVFSVGILVGVLAGAFLVAHFWTPEESSFSIHDIWAGADWSRRVTRAVAEEEPKVAIWALENYIDVLQDRERRTEEIDLNLIRHDLTRAFIMLAAVAHKSGDVDKTDSAARSALRYAELCGARRYRDLKTVEDVLNHEQKEKEMLERLKKEKQNKSR